MKIFYTPGTCSTAPRILLAEAGIACEQELVSFKTKQTASGADYLQINPNGYVPALQLDDGSILTEGPAIDQYIADLAPEKKLAPANGTPERYRMQSWLNFIATELHKGGYSILFDRGAAEEWKDAARTKLAKRLAHVDAVLADRPYLLGADFGCADAYLFVVLGWSEFAHVDLAPFANLKAFLERVAARPAVQAVKAMDAKK
ncbi:MAG TPA: glutathione transferase GstA [Rhodocyclaceae bacterium]|nr:glutathione transferase GstA [Rhodocyclaceae bacterium]